MNGSRAAVWLSAASLVVVVGVGIGIGASDTSGREKLGRPARGVVALIQASSPDDDVFNGQFCGGVLTEPDIVMTAAHCVRGRLASDVDVVVDGDNLCAGHPIDGERVAVNVIDIHPRYDATAGSHDIARLILAHDVADRSTRTVTVDPPVGSALVALGWGSTSVGGASSCRLTKVELRVVDPSVCVEETGGTNHTFDPRSMLCANPVDPRVDTCTGDSGGPLIGGDDVDTGRIVGIVSWGLGCAAGHPGVYAMPRWP